MTVLGPEHGLWDTWGHLSVTVSHNTHATNSFYGTWPGRFIQGNLGMCSLPERKVSKWCLSCLTLFIHWTPRSTISSKKRLKTPYICFPVTQNRTYETSQLSPLQHHLSQNNKNKAKWECEEKRPISVLVSGINGKKRRMAKVRVRGSATPKDARFTVVLLRTCWPNLPTTNDFVTLHHLTAPWLCCHCFFVF